MSKHRRVRRNRLASVDFKDLRREMARRERRRPSLEKKRDRLLARVHEYEAEIIELGGQPARTHGRHNGRRRFKNKMNLPETLAVVLKGKAMSVTDAAQAAKDAGYRTRANGHFRTMVNQALINHPEKFKKVERGVYIAK